MSRFSVFSEPRELNRSVVNSPLLIAENGVTYVVNMEDLPDPSEGVPFTDFSVDSLVKSGVKMHPIDACDNPRLGHDDVINEFEEHMSIID